MTDHDDQDFDWSADWSGVEAVEIDLDADDSEELEHRQFTQTADEKTIRIIAGHGGPGLAAFHREKYVDRGGPDGGDGGAGGDVYIRINRKIKNLGHIHPHRKYKGGAGNPGRRNACSGADGDDLYIEVPPGTEVFDAETDEIIFDFSDPATFDKPLLIAKGGKGGMGNQHFATSRNQAPTYAQPGLPGQERLIRFNLKLIADLGLVGLPNAGKSTFLKAVTGAHPKIAAYPFTTLKPNIGMLIDDDYNQYTLADIPGIIEGASQGQGLGLAFLRHIERVRALVFMTDVQNLAVRAEYDLLVLELNSYNPEILEKPQIMVVNKVDTVDAELLDDIKNDFAGQMSDTPVQEIYWISAKRTLALREAGGDDGLPVSDHPEWGLNALYRKLCDLAKTPLKTTLPGGEDEVVAQKEKDTENLDPNLAESRPHYADERTRWQAKNPEKPLDERFDF